MLQRIQEFQEIPEHNPNLIYDNTHTIFVYQIYLNKFILFQYDKGI